MRQPNIQGFCIHPSTPMTPTWIICAWPPLKLSAQEAPELQFVHLNTKVSQQGGSSHPSKGQTLWGNPEPHAAGVAWDWVQLCDGVFALADPMGLVTNLKLVGTHGEALSDTQMALYLNELVSTLPWQTEVQRELQNRHKVLAGQH
jgi:hypothetical protein